MGFKNELFAVSAKLQNCLELFDVTLEKTKSSAVAREQVEKLVAAIMRTK